MTEREFAIGNRKFKLNKIDPHKQFHIVRRVAPLIAELLPALGRISKTKVEGSSEEDKVEEFAKIMAPIMEGFSKLPDADADYVLFKLLASVEIQQEQFNVWAKIANDSGIIMQDLELPVLLQAAGRAFVYNLSGFFAFLPRA